MKKKFLIFIFCIFAYTVFPLKTLAVDIPPLETSDNKSITEIFGTIKPPSQLEPLTKDQTGAQGISKLLSNIITLFYSLAAVVLVFMFLWGGFDWITSEGEKEKVSAAQKKIINAIIGIILFAAAFAIFNLLGRFTGFTFFLDKSAAGCASDSFYFDTDKNLCVHKVYSTVNGVKCQEVFITVANSLCGR